MSIRLIDAGARQRADETAGRSADAGAKRRRGQPAGCDDRAEARDRKQAETGEKACAAADQRAERGARAGPVPVASSVP